MRENCVLNYYFWGICRCVEVCDLWFVFDEGDSDRYCEIGGCFEDCIEDEEGCCDVVLEEVKNLCFCDMIL